MIRMRSNTAIRSTTAHHRGCRPCCAVRWCGAAIIVLALLLPWRLSIAANVPWKPGQFDYVADGKSLKDVLRDFAASQGIPIDLDASLEGKVSGRFNLLPQQFLSLMASTHGFIWYYDGAVLFVSPASQSGSAFIQLGEASIERLQESLAALDLADSRFRLHYDPRENTAIVKGPQRYVDKVTELARRVDDNARRAQIGEVRVFRLRHARASDTTLQLSGRSVVIPGVVTELRNLYGRRGSAMPVSSANSRVSRLTGASAAASASNRYRLSTGATVPLPSATGLPRVNDTAGLNSLLPSGTNDEASNPIGNADELPVFQADTRNNAVLVRDLPSRLRAYESIIADLDVRPGIVQIEARIIEIQSDALEQLGIDWRLNTSKVDFQYGNGRNQIPRFNGSLSSSQPGGDPTVPGVPPLFPIGATLTTVIGNAGSYLLTRISALEQRDQARITASPVVTTLDNVEAVMDNTETFYVRVAGYQTADLFSVSAGVSLRVLPSIVADGETTQIKLDVHIEDGKFTAQTVDQLPVVTRSEIRTQAYVADGDSLLVAGYSLDQNVEQLNEVPGLSKIPLIGGMFRHKQEQSRRFQRLFLLTPRLVLK